MERSSPPTLVRSFRVRFPSCCTGDPRLRPQRGRLRGAGRAAGRRRVGPHRGGGRGGRPRQHLRIREPARRRTRSTPCWPPRTPAGRSSPSAAWPSGTAPSWPTPARDRRRARLRRVLRHRRAAGRRARRAPAVPHTPRDRRTLLPITPVERRAAGSSVPGHGAAPAGPGRPAGAAGAAPAAGGLARRPAEARLRLRPALRVLRDPVLPWLVRLPAAGRGARRGAGGWPSTGSASWCWSVRTPPRTARISAICGCWRSCSRAGRGGRHRPGPGDLSAAGRDPARAGGPRSPARPASLRTSTCPSSTPAVRPCPDDGAQASAARHRRASDPGRTSRSHSGACGRVACRPETQFDR